MAEKRDNYVKFSSCVHGVGRWAEARAVTCRRPSGDEHGGRPATRLGRDGRDGGRRCPGRYPAGAATAGPGPDGGVGALGSGASQWPGPPGLRGLRADVVTSESGVRGGGVVDDLRRSWPHRGRPLATPARPGDRWAPAGAVRCRSAPGVTTAAGVGSGCGAGRRRWLPEAPPVERRG